MKKFQFLNAKVEGAQSYHYELNG